ncbi:glycosyltransferase family 2 protein [Halalkalibacter akibai]|uniref:Glycosyltransferase n=1 Tax=Halalkalibacter akibai (strain ATCC 43226 / DSM 21942 / CIP 109018 / JCM 9157 / 1139) TaxID=1236973 RepID=W4QSA4_HALA3|nr:glycosyltransferase [Halalkalibacter akibai]GAE34817.1 glycosyltransferase [Halalkalibacter akibai JCM 9157]
MFTVVCCTKRGDHLENVLNNFNSQRFDDKELLIILNNNELDLHYYENVTDGNDQIRVYQLDEKVSLGESLNFAVKRAKKRYIAKFDDDDYYSPKYLQEASDVITATKAKVVGKASVYIYYKDDHTIGVLNEGKENMYIHKPFFLMGSTLIMEKTLLHRFPFSNVNLGEDLDIQQRWYENHISMYSGSKHHYAYIRYEDLAHHTSDASSARLKKHCSHLVKVNSFKKYVEYNS